jgi:hypothetical protein
MVEIVTSVANARGARIKPAELRKLPLHACCLCLALGSVYLRRNNPEYPCKKHRL